MNIRIAGKAAETGKNRAGAWTRSGAFYLWIGMLIPLLVTFLGFIIIKVWPFGDGTVLIIDSLHQYLPFYTDFHEKLVHHESLFYSFSGGLGYNFWGTYAYYLASPLNLLIVLVPTANVGDFMDLMILLKIGLCGGIFSWYLHKCRPQERFLPLVFGTMYALGNFIIGYYFNLMWLDSIAFVPLIMYGIELITRGKKGWVYGLSLFYALWCNYYIGFMLCIFSCLYLLVCFAQREGMNTGRFVRRSLKFAWYSLLAGGCASVVLLPAYRTLAASESMMSNSFPSRLKFYTDFLSMFIAHFAAEHPINISDSQVGLNAYCGCAVLILVICFALDEKIRLRRKIPYLLLTALLFMSVTVNYLNYMWHGFHTQNGLPNRFAFLYVLMLLILCFDVMEDLRTMAVWKLLLSGLLPLGLSLFAVAARKTDWETYGAWNYLTPLFLLIYLAAILILRASKVSRRMISFVLGVLMMAEACVHGIYGIIYNENVTRSIYLKDQASYKNLMKEQGDTDFFRAEIDSQRMRNVAMFAGAHSTVLFNSTMQESVTDFFDRMGIEARTNKNGYNGVTRLFNDVFGIRYVLSSNGRADTLYQFPKIGGDGNLDLYKNDNALSIGFMTNAELRYWDPIDNDPIGNQNEFVQLATGLDDLYVLDRTVEAKDGEENQVKIPEGKQVYVYLPDRIKTMKVVTPEYSRNYTTYTDHLYTMNAAGGSDIASFTCDLKETQTGESAKVYTCSDADYEAVREVLAREQLQDVEVTGSSLTGNISVSKSGILLLTVPYDQSWTVKVDSEKITPLKIGGALIGAELGEGDHQIRMTYMPAGFKGGLLLTILCLLLMGGTILLERRSRKQGDGSTMQIRFAERMQSFEPGIFTQLEERRQELVSSGRTIYNLSVGTPDFETPKPVREAVCEAAKDPANFRYSLGDIPEMTSAVQAFYERRFGVRLEPGEIMSVYGSQEGMAHIAWTMCDPGDVVLAPNPGYPIFRIGPELCGADVYEYPLLQENDFLPDLDAIPEDILSRAKLMIVSYPGNPLGKAAPESFYEKLIAFAREHSIVIVHDNAYADIIYGGREGRSFLSFEGAKEVGVEFYSLSKTFDYTGARLSFVVGNEKVVERFRTLRSQFDYGIFLPVQYGAVAALNMDWTFVQDQCAEYERRNETLCSGLRSLGWQVENSEGTMFVWAPLPEGYRNSEEFVMELMDKTGVICTPGSSFGSLGEGYVRFALVLPCEKLEEAIESIRRSGMIRRSQ